jgi:hypothetical protein
MRRLVASALEIAGIAVVAVSLWQLADWAAGVWVGLWLLAASVVLGRRET